jgi:hypothetical protein
MRYPLRTSIPMMCWQIEILMDFLSYSSYKMPTPLQLHK